MVARDVHDELRGEEKGGERKRSGEGEQGQLTAVLLDAIGAADVVFADTGNGRRRRGKGGTVGAIFLHLFVHKTLVTSCHYDFEKPSLLFRFLPFFCFAFSSFCSSLKNCEIL